MRGKRPLIDVSFSNCSASPALWRRTQQVVANVRHDEFVAAGVALVLALGLVLLVIIMVRLILIVVIAVLIVLVAVIVTVFSSCSRCCGCCCYYCCCCCWRLVGYRL